MKALLLSYRGIVTGAFLLAMIPALAANGKAQEFRATYQYNLSDFNGTVRYLWPKFTVNLTQNEVFVLDPKERDIRIFNESGMEVFRFGEDGEFPTVMDVAVSDTGDIYVISRSREGCTIIPTNYRGEPLGTEIRARNLPPEYATLRPDRVALQNRAFYFVDSNQMKIAVTDLTGSFVRGMDLKAILDFDSMEEKETEGADITGFSVDKNGNVYFTIAVFFSAYRLSPDGRVERFGQAGSGPGKFAVVSGIVSDSDGYIYVSDRLRSAVLAFDSDLKFVGEFGYRGDRPENLIVPDHLAVDGKDRLYVAQAANRGVSVFSITKEEDRPIEERRPSASIRREKELKGEEVTEEVPKN